MNSLWIGKEIVFQLKAISEKEAKSQVQEMCERLLANPIIEDYKIEVSQI